MRHIQYARIEGRACPLALEQCWTRVVEHYAAFLSSNVDRAELARELDAKVPRYVRGSKKGQRKGTAIISVCTEGGWQRLGYGAHNGRVLYPGSVVGVWAGIRNGYQDVTFFSVGE